MALEIYQTKLTLAKLYRVKKSNLSATEQLKPNLFINSGSVDVRSYNGSKASGDIALADMLLPATDTDVSIHKIFEIIPKYIYITQNTGTTTDLVASGLQVELIGDIS